MMKKKVYEFLKLFFSDNAARFHQGRKFRNSNTFLFDRFWRRLRSAHFIFFFLGTAFHALHTGLTWNIHSHSKIWPMIRWWWLCLCNSLYNWRDRPVWNYGDKSLLSSSLIHFELSVNRFVTRCRFPSYHLCICCAIIHNYYILSFRNLLSFISCFGF